MQQQYYVNRPEDVYRKQAILTASPVELIVLLYDGCRKNLLMAQRFVEKKDVEGAHRHFVKAQNIISELVTSLDMRYEISEQLLDLYEFILIRIGEMNIHKNVEQLPAVLEILDTLRNTWQTVSDQQAKGSLSLAED